MKKAILTVLITLSLSLLAVAHGDMEHVFGTVMKITDESLEVKLRDGTIKNVIVDDGTKFMKGNSPATKNDVVVGSRVVIHAHKHGDSLHAAEVKIGATVNPAQHHFAL